MSYILDALRKSEQERRNQDSSAAFSPTMPDSYRHQESRSNPWVWISVAVILSVNVLALLVIFKDELFGKVEKEKDVVELVSAPVSVPVVISKPSREKEAHLSSDVEVSSSSVPDQYKVYQPVNNQELTKPSLGEVGFEYSEQDVIRPRKKPYTALKEESPSLVERYQEHETMQSQAKYDVVNLREDSGADQTNLRAQLLEGLEEPDVIKPTSLNSEVMSAQRNVLSRAEVAQLPTIQELSVAQQGRIPAIQFSGHLYSSRPESRSIRLGQNKYKEGDSLTRNLSLNMITEDGVVFDLNGQLFYMSSFEDWLGIE